jgi:hypothetical protein
MNLDDGEFPTNQQVSFSSDHKEVMCYPDNKIPELPLPHSNNQKEHVLGGVLMKSTKKTIFTVQPAACSSHGAVSLRWSTC